MLFYVHTVRLSTVINEHDDGFLFTGFYPEIFPKGVWTWLRGPTRARPEGPRAGGRVFGEGCPLPTS